MSGTNAQNQNLQSLSAVFREAALSQKKASDALACATLYGRLHWLNISGFFGDNNFEKALFERWSGVLFGPLEETEPPTEDHWMHVASKFYPHGGHTRLFREIFEGLREQGVTQSLIITRKMAKRTEAVLEGLEGRTSFLKGNLAARARALFQHARRARVVVFHIHPDDIGAALAARALRRIGCTVLFVNHADHVFSFGPGGCSAVLEICATGWKTTATRRAAKAQSFLGIPTTLASAEVPSFEREKTAPILSVGIQQKYEPTSALNFASFLEDLMERVPNEVYLIGPEPDHPMWQPLLEKYPERLRIPGPQPFSVVEQSLQKASCYVDSFPFDGGTIFTQALMSGTPVFGPNRSAAPGVSPIDALRAGSVDSLIESIVSYQSSEFTSVHFAKVAQEVIDLLSRQSVTERLIGTVSGDFFAVPASLAELGNRSIDYNAERWRQKGSVNIPRDSWRKLSLGGRLRLLNHVKNSRVSTSTLKRIRLMLFFG